MDRTLPHTVFLTEPFPRERSTQGDRDSADAPKSDVCARPSDVLARAEHIAQEVRTCMEAVRTLDQALVPMGARGESAQRARLVESELRSTLHLLGETVAAFDTSDDTYSASGAIADVAFIARLELTAALERLAESTLAEEADALDTCRSTLRRVLKALRAVDAELAPLVGQTPALLYRDHLEDALATRKHYARLRRTLQELGAHSDRPSMLHALFGVRAHLQLLRASDVYPVLRQDDRVEFEQLHRRIDATLRAVATDLIADVELTHLLQDLSGFATMLTQVNRRQELIEHDAEHLASLGDTMTRDDLEPLYGLDDTLDAHLDGSLLASDELQTTLTRLAQARIPAKPALRTQRRVVRGLLR